VTARLYLDEDIVPELARILRSRGFDVVSVHEIGALGLPDEEQLRRAADARILLIFNYHDFLPIFSEWLAAGRNHAGIVVSYRQYRRNQLSLYWQTPSNAYLPP
jgi:hypothetical protein